MPSRAARGVLSVENLTLRLVQMTAAGTYGAYVDAVQGFSWLPTARGGPEQGLNGHGGWVQAEHKPVLNDSTEFQLTLPPIGTDGRDNKQRLFFFADTIDPSNPTARTPYFPGDEWIEVWRGTGEVVAVGTPISGTATPSALNITCRCVTQPLKKQRETASGFWQANAPRDVFEYYTRLWQSVAADDFESMPSTFSYIGCSGLSPAGTTAVRIAPGGAGQGGITSVASTPSGTFPQHGAIRLEACLSNVAANPPPQTPATAYLNLVDTAGNDYATIAITLTGEVFLGVVVAPRPSGPATFVNFPVLTSSVVSGSGGQPQVPYVLALEVRDRWTFFYLNGQLVGVAPQPYFGAGVSLRGQMEFAHPNGGSLGSLWVDVDYIVFRHTTKPLNGGLAGDYVLPSPPAPGGLTAEYYDLTQLTTYMASPIDVGRPDDEAISDVAGAPTIGSKVSESVEMSVCSGSRDSVLPDGLPTTKGVTGVVQVAPCYIRRSGAIWLPLATQDVHFTVAVAGEEFPGAALTVALWPFRLYVGRTRRGEELLAGFKSDPGRGYSTTSVTSAGLRATLGSVTGWYPIVFEICLPAQQFPPDLVLTWDGPGGGQPSPTFLAPLGCYRGQVADGDSHYDTLVSFTQSFPYQWKSEPKQLESGWFPGAIVPRVRVGRDTSFTVDQAIATSPTDNIDATDVASTLLGNASGLGGASSGQITMEAFDFEGMGKHPFVSQESESLPSTNIAAQLTQQLLTLLGLRLSPWEDVQATTPGLRQMQDAWPPSLVLPQIAEFDWQPGDSVLIDLPEIGVVDLEPRQILALTRVLYPDGIGTNTASFRPRPRNFAHTIRQFARRVFAASRTFQGQLIIKPGTRAVGPAYSEAILPSDISLVRQAQLIVLTKDDSSTGFDLEVNGTVVAPQAVFTTGAVDLRAYVGRNFNAAVETANPLGSPEPRMLVRLVNPSAACNVSYQMELTVLLPHA